MSQSELLAEHVRLAIESAKVNGMLPVYIAQVLREQIKQLSSEPVPEGMPVKSTKAILWDAMDEAFLTALQEGMLPHNALKAIREHADYKESRHVAVGLQDKPKRKIVQICITGDDGYLYALCDDGSLWCEGKGPMWHRIAIEQVERAE